MPDYKISLELPNVSDIQRVVNGTIFPMVAQAVRAIAQEAQMNWIEAVKNAKLWDGEKSPYIKSIVVRYLTDLSAEVVSDYKYAYEIENGRPSRDLKAMLNTSSKVRRTKDGKRFLVIPLRQNTPGNTALASAMPSSIYALAKEMKASSVTGSHMRPSGEITNISPSKGLSASLHQTPYMSHIGSKKAFLVSSNQYKWGGHMTRLMLRDAGATKAEQRTYGGMVRMKESTGGSQYLTFRLMVEGSRGWVIRQKPGLLLAKGVAEHLQPIATAAIAEAMRRESNS
jgi:hypothetical protein